MKYIDTLGLVIPLVLMAACSPGPEGSPQALPSPQKAPQPPPEVSPPLPLPKPKPQAPAEISLSRKDLLSSKKNALQQIITNLISRPGRPKKETFTMALEQYEKIIPSYEDEIIQLLRNDALDNVPAIDQKINEIQDTELISTKDFMHYHLPQKAYGDSVINYMDFANASLGGGAFSEGWVQEEQMVAFCAELALLLAGRTKANPLNIDDINYITRSTRNTNILSPRPKYIKNLRCATGTKKGIKLWKDMSSLENNDTPPSINIIAAAATDVQGAISPYTPDDIYDLFSNIYRAFELVKKSNGAKKNTIFGGLFGAGVFGHSTAMSVALQILAARILGIERLVLTSAPKDNYKTAIDKVDKFLKSNNIKNMTIKEMLDAFLALVKDKKEWKKNAKYLV